MKPYYLLVLLVIAACGSDTEETAPQESTRKYFTLWSDSTSTYLPKTGEWTNRVEVADLNNDGRVDILFANGGNYSEPGPEEPCRVFINNGPGRMFTEVTQEIFGNQTFHSRVVKVRDINGDSYADIFVGNTYQSQSRLYLGDSAMNFRDATTTHLPAIDLSVGDAEFGDADGDGDLDLILADWGAGDNMNNEGGRTQLWLNDGEGKFANVTAAQMPETLVRFSWDLEFIDFDNDFDLDIAVSCKRCAGSKLFVNDGTGRYEDNSWAIPSYTNNYEFEAMDVDHDRFLDLITVNDGDILNGNSYSRREHVFRNMQGEYFSDVTSTQWPASENVGEDDNNVTFLDANSDRHPDFLLSSLTGEDRLLINDGNGNFSLRQPVIQGDPTPNTLSLVVADINGDNKLDIVMGQGEGETNLDERIFIGNSIGPDKAYPRIPITQITDTLGFVTIHARIHDCKSPSMPHDWTSVLFLPEEDSKGFPMEWYGEFLWRVSVPDSIEIDIPRICATDAAGNVRCRVVN